MNVLGVETSCDDTSLALVRDGRLVGCLTSSQTVTHQRFGGVVPEVASREHLKEIIPLYHRLLSETGVLTSDLDLIGATFGPGLSGSLLVGAQFASGLSAHLGCPCLPVNHLEGHVFSVFLDGSPLPAYPWLILLVSGGHTALILALGPHSYRMLGETIDDSVGECFDKVARFLSLDYPGGPQIEQKAEGGAVLYQFPQSFLKEKDYRFSYSGLKTAVCSFTERNSFRLNDICCSFQTAAINPLLVKIKQALTEFSAKVLLIAGGVSANNFLRSGCLKIGEKHGIQVLMPERKWAMDNAGMIALAAYHIHKSGKGLQRRSIDPGWTLC
ncbi:MAG: tRNA (adenosine(37)-N6)-threonylcarbamoyltransferase complex transferase subunit TsaD [Candidatus Wallbacteria bacterium]|nr:tRNA (adenosine(37)-N6)-threonylcarbamoyltransferase complex transferase subunit TsaD [Candidatus Wallbacteria bacterium]